MSEIVPIIAQRLRAEREARGLSLSALARAAGIGKGSLSELENATRNPTISTLYALADALGVPLATLLAERLGSEIGAPGFAAVLLDVRRHEQTIVEVYRLALAPGTVRRSGAHGAAVREHALVTLGRLRVGPTGRERELACGESASWVSDGPHRYAALGSEPAEAVLVIRSPA